MKTVMNWFEVQQRLKAKGDLGIEIEVEGANLPAPPAYWRREEDGSLRGGENAEYVFRKPLTLEQAHSALMQLGEAYKANNSRIDDSVRAGIHVHVNVQDLSLIELFNFITVYVVLEEILVDHCGEGRQGNLFCLRAMDAGYLISTIRRAIAKRQFRVLGNDELRYSSMNVKSLSTYGSLEFRAMRGTSDMDKIYDWAKLLLNLREVAKTFYDPKAVIQGFSEGEAAGFIYRCLGEQAEAFLGDPEVLRKVKSGMRRAQDIAYACNWEMYREQPTYMVGGLAFPINMQYPNEPLEDF